MQTTYNLTPEEAAEMIRRHDEMVEAEDPWRLGEISDEEAESLITYWREQKSKKRKKAAIEPNPKKTCRKCGAEKPTFEFYKGLVCHDCRREYEKEWQRANRPKKCQACRVIKPADEFRILTANGNRLRICEPCRTSETRLCKLCRIEKPRYMFAARKPRHAPDVNFTSSTCDDCARAKVKTKSRAEHHGITEEQYKAMVANQDNKCKTCGTEFTNEPRKRNSKSIDHDHQCCPGPTSCGKCVRAILCTNCNTGLGMMGDNIETLKAAVKMLEEWNANFWSAPIALPKAEQP